MKILKLILLIAFLLLTSYFLSVVFVVEPEPKVERQKSLYFMNCEYLGNKEWDCVKIKEE